RSPGRPSAPSDRPSALPGRAMLSTGLAIFSPERTGSSRSAFGQRPIEELEAILPPERLALVDVPRRAEDLIVDRRLRVAFVDLGGLAGCRGNCCGVERAFARDGRQRRG